MPRLPFFLRPPPGPTVPNNYTEVHSELTGYTTINLPTSGSALYQNTFTIPFTLRPGYLIMVIFHYDTIGFDYSARRWMGFWDRALNFPANPFPIGYGASNQINIGMGGVEGMDDAAIVPNVFTRTQVIPEMKFTFSERAGSTPYPVRIRWGIRIFKPTSFTPWQP
jgi:hypothetical protein